MAHLRDDYGKFTALGAEVITLGPDGPRAFKNHWQINEMPFIGLSDIKSKNAEKYYQEVNLIKLGRMPAVFIIDPQGIIRYVHYGDSMKDIPENSELLMFIEKVMEYKE